MSYAKNAALAKRLIASKGRPGGVIRRPSSDNTSTADTPWKTTDAAQGTDPIVASSIPHVVFDASVVADDIDVAVGASAVAFIAASQLGSAPVVGDILETKSKRYILVQVDDLSPGDTSLLYTLHLKAS